MKLPLPPSYTFRPIQESHPSIDVLPDYDQPIPEEQSIRPTTPLFNGYYLPEGLLKNTTEDSTTDTHISFLDTIDMLCIRVRKTRELFDQLRPMAVRNNILDELNRSIEDYESKYGPGLDEGQRNQFKTHINSQINLSRLNHLGMFLHPFFDKAEELDPSGKLKQTIITLSLSLTDKYGLIWSLAIKNEFLFNASRQLTLFRFKSFQRTFRLNALKKPKSAFIKYKSEKTATNDETPLTTSMTLGV